MVQTTPLRPVRSSGSLPPAGPPDWQPPASAPDPGPDGPVGLSVSWSARGRYAVAALSGELDIACAASLREQLIGALKPGASRLVIELSLVTYCDASGLAVLVPTGRRAELLGGVLRLAAPAPFVASALRAMGLHRRFDIFASLQAAAASSPPGQIRPFTRAIATVAEAARMPQLKLGRGNAGRVVGTGELRAAVADLLSHADAWRDADPGRRFAPALQVLSRAYARTDNALLTEAARSLLSILTEHALDHSPPVAATASRLRRLLGTG
jgi:anti-anti-sigma factor